MLQSIGSMPRMASSLSPIVVDDMPAAQRSLRIALVTETYPPEVNGVALTLQRIVEGCMRITTTSSWCDRARPWRTWLCAPIASTRC